MKRLLVTGLLAVFCSLIVWHDVSATGYITGPVSVFLQATTPGTQQTGNFNVSGAGVIGAGAVSNGYKLSINDPSLSPSSQLRISNGVAGANGNIELLARDIDNEHLIFGADNNLGVWSALSTNAEQFRTSATSFDLLLATGLTIGNTFAWPIPSAVSFALSTGAATFGSTITSDNLTIAHTAANATATINAATASNQALVQFSDQGTLKYGIGKNTDNSFHLYDFANAQDAWSYSPGAIGSIRVPTSNVGIGASPTYPLDISAQVGQTHARFGATNAVYFVSNYPTIAFNSLYNIGWRYGGSGFGSYIQHDVATGDMSFQTAPTGIAGAVAPFTERFRIGNTGAVTTTGTLASNNATITHNAATAATLDINNQTATQQSIVEFQDQGVTKYRLGRQTDNTFFMYDVANNRGFVTYDPVANKVSAGAGVSTALLVGGTLTTNTALAGGLTQEVWIAPTLSGTWANVGGTNATIGYMKDSQGFVHLRGEGTSGAAAAMFTLPAGYIIAKTQVFSTDHNGAYGTITVSTLGVVSSGTFTNVWLSGITFDTR